MIDKSLNIDDIISYKGNIIINASAGTGKTTFLASKINADFNNPTFHKGFIAITFTNSAANELKNRLLKNFKNSCVDTNFSFVYKEIVIPFISDYLGEKIENLAIDFSKSVLSFEEGINYIKTENVIPIYRDKSKNFLFSLALEILKNSKASRLYLKSKYLSMYIDEYQDCDSDMHNLFMYISENLNLITFIVGDYKQSIYKWRGAKPELFLSILENNNFKKFELTVNHRSCEQIVNFSNLIYPKTRNLCNKCNEKSSVICLLSTLQNWNSDILSYIDSNLNCALIRRKNEDAIKSSELLNNFVYIFKPKILNISDNSSWIYVNIAKLFIVPKYSIYDFLEDIPDYIVSKIDDKLKIIHILSSIKDLKKSLDFSLLKILINELLNLYDYYIDEQYFDVLKETILSNRNHPYFNLDNYKNISLTCHLSKGLGFDQVIIFLNDYTLENDNISEFYVAVTRARTKLIMVVLKDLSNDNLKRFRENLKLILNDIKVNFNELVSIVDATKTS